MSSKLPDFIIVGAVKSGTTSVYRYLSKHPEIFMPAKKEIWFLQLSRNPNKEILNRIPDLPTTFTDYTSFFKDADTDQLKGESCPSYLMFPEYTIESVLEYFPPEAHPKIIIILREPFDKILSQYRFNLKIRTEYLSLEEALKKEKERHESYKSSVGFNYVSSTLYYEQVKKFKDSFKNVKVFLFDDLKKDSKSFMTDICDFLDIDPGPVVNSSEINKVYNKSKSNKDKDMRWTMVDLLFGFINTVVKYFFYNALPISLKKKLSYFRYADGTINELPVNKKNNLKEIFKEDVLKLQKLINRDLSDWIKKYS